MILVDKIAIISKKNEVGIGFDALEDVLEDYLTFFQGGCVGGHQDAAQIAVHGFGTIEYKGGVVFFPVHDVEAVCLLDQGFVVDVGFVLLIEEVVEGIEVLVWLSPPPLMLQEPPVACQFCWYSPASLKSVV